MSLFNCASPLFEIENSETTECCFSSIPVVFSTSIEFVAEPPPFEDIVRLPIFFSTLSVPVVDAAPFNCECDLDRTVSVTEA